METSLDDFELFSILMRIISEYLVHIRKMNIYAYYEKDHSLIDMLKKICYLVLDKISLVFRIKVYDFPIAHRIC